MSNAHALGLTALRILLGVFFLFMSLSKIAWLTDSSILVGQLTGWANEAGPFSRWYLETFCLPGAPIFARVVPVAELSTGLALILGIYTRIAATLGLLMILNFHVASGIIFTYAYLTNGYGLPVLGGLVALALGGSNLPMSVKR
jgi:thiosulfate dehydrogenase [quinone] large subunit